MRLGRDLKPHAQSRRDNKNRLFCSLVNFTEETLGCTKSELPLFLRETLVLSAFLDFDVFYYIQRSFKFLMLFICMSLVDTTVTKAVQNLHTKSKECLSGGECPASSRIINTPTHSTGATYHAMLGNHCRA